tara:strand:+ start:213 stop:569 length:357 start_codon:yes stop_codon:yes gene_type:complete
MTHFALINKKNIVIHVIVAEQDYINTLDNCDSWIQTSYNTYGGVNHRTNIPIRKNYAGLGYTYDRKKDCFIAPKPFKSWKLNEITEQWNAPVPKPKSKTQAYIWNEAQLKWEKEKVNV